MLTSFFDPVALSRTVLDLLEDTALNRKLRANARGYAEARLSMADYMVSYEALIERMTGMRLPKADTMPVLRVARARTSR